MPPKARILRDPNETPTQRFHRVAQPRITNIVSAIRSIAAWNRVEYGPPSPRDVEEMFGAIERALGEAKEAFRQRAGQRRSAFKFSSQNDGQSGKRG